MERLMGHLMSHPLEVGLGILVMILLGLYGAAHMSVDLFPDLDVPVVSVIVHAPGTSAGDLERGATRLLEQALKGASGIRRVASTTIPEVAVITVQFAWGLPVRDARQIVLGRLAEVRSKLPAGVRFRLEHIGTTLQEVGAWAIWGAGDPQQVGPLVRRDLAARLMDVPGVSLVDVLGGERRALWVSVRPERLAALGLSLASIESAIRRTHGAALAGFVERANEDVVVRTDSRLLTAKALAAVPIPLAGGDTLTLGQIATVREGRAPRHSEVRAQGVPALTVFVRKQPGASTIAVSRALDAEFLRLRSLLPAGMHMERFYDQAEVLVLARETLRKDLLLGAALAVLVLWFFIGALYPTFVVALTIPIALLATLGVLWLGGQTLNVITMAALTLAVGMIVDDAIVVTENIFRHRETGLTRKEAACRGTAEIAAADAAGTFTTVSAFLPLLLPGGLAAVFLRPFGLTVGAALLLSLVLSLSMVPVLLGRGRSRARVGSFWPGFLLVKVLGVLLGWILGWTLRHRWLTLFLALMGTLALGVMLWQRPGVVSLLPPVDEGTLLVEYILPPGVSLRESVRVGQKIARRAAKLPGVKLVEQRVGAPPGGPGVEGSDRGELLMKLAPRTSGRPSAQALLDLLARRTRDLRGVVLLFHQPTQERMEEAFSGLPTVFGATIFGPDLKVLEGISRQVQQILEEDPDVVNVLNNARFHRPRLDVQVDGARCAALGVDPREVRRTVAGALWGEPVLTVLHPREEVQLFLRVQGEGRGLDDLASLLVSARGGALVPLANVARLIRKRVPPRLDRQNGQRELTLLGEVDGNILKVAGRLDRRFQELALPSGYSVACTGQYQTLLKTAGNLLFVLVAGGLLILAIMTIEFHSLRQGLWILLMVASGLSGGAAGLALTGAGLNVAVAAGALTLMGIGVNNGIILVDLANRLRLGGRTPEEALQAAARTRLRPILATTLTTAAGLLPSALALGSGPSLFQPFAITVICGLMTGTLATLFILPAGLLPSLARKRYTGREAPSARA